jgi:hypothetical protein
MSSIDPRPAFHDQPARALDAETSPPGDFAHKECGMTCRMARSGGFTTMAVIAVAVIVVAGVSSGWNGWLAASFGGISLLFLLPCLAMCVGMIWMMMRASNDQSSKDPER